MIQKCEPTDFKDIYRIINDAASAYKGIIPADRWEEPYMSEEELKLQMEQGVEFWCYRQGEQIEAVMGVQPKGEVTLIRHAYVQTTSRGKGIGSHLLMYLLASATTTVLVGTWEAASWAIAFYQKHGFQLVSSSEKEALLQRYWSIPKRQIETSVVLARKSLKEACPNL